MTADHDDFQRPPEDARVAQTRQLILAAARQILLAEGQEAVTPTRLANLTGVSRSTIYRNWDEPADIIFEATAADTQVPPFSPSGDTRADVISYLGALRSMLESTQATLLATRVDRAEHDADTAATLRAVADGRRDLIRDLLGHTSSDFGAWHALLVGPLFYQRFMARQPVTDDLIRLVAEAYVAIPGDSAEA